MPLPIAHALVGATLNNSFSKSPQALSFKAIFLSIILALCPDFDYGLNVLRVAGGGWHHGFTHSFLFALAIGFALAGTLASGYQAWAQRPAGFGLLNEGVVPKAFAAVPFLVFAAPFIIMRNTLVGAKIERRRFEFVMIATMIAGFWSLMSGTFFLMTLRVAGLLA